MLQIDLGVGAFVGIVLGASVLSYLLGRVTGERAERRLWERRIAGEVRELDRTRAIIRRALEKNASHHHPHDFHRHGVRCLCGSRIRGMGQSGEVRWHQTGVMPAIPSEFP